MIFFFHFCSGKTASVPEESGGAPREFLQLGLDWSEVHLGKKEKKRASQHPYSVARGGGVNGHL